MELQGVSENPVFVLVTPYLEAVASRHAAAGLACAGRCGVCGTPADRYIRYVVTTVTL